MTNDFGRINHRKWWIHFNASFARRDCSLMVQENISTLHSDRIKPKNKFDTWKVCKIIKVLINHINYHIDNWLIYYFII